MTPERLHKIDRLLEEVLSRSPDEHTTFLDEVCDGDPDMRVAIESLIAYERANSILETPALKDFAEMFESNPALSRVGKVLGPYRIDELIDSGGMGDVYLAKDQLLDKKVAIKFLRTYLQADEVARNHLIREARTVAKLDHPNICPIHAVGQEGGQVYLVMQHIEGESLATRIRRGALELDETLEVGTSVAEALIHAHSRGIIHRDIKPHNVMISLSGQVKVLDFGLAKLVQSAEVEAADSQIDVKRLELQLSGPGVRVGTPQYMSPEQAQSWPVDERSDLFSLGVLLYESITGTRPFAGHDESELRSRVIDFDPPAPSRINSDVPPQLDKLVARALQKDPNDRYQTAAEMLEDLREMRSKPPGLFEFLSDAYRRSPLFATLTLAVMLVVVLAVLFWPAHQPPVHKPPQDALDLYSLGTGQLRNGSYFEAANTLGKATEKDDKFALAHVHLAEAWAELDYSERASNEMLRATRARETSSMLPIDSLRFQATTHIVLREFEQAIASYRELIGQAPESEKAPTLLGLGRAYEKNDQIQKAIDTYQEAAGRASEDPVSLLRLGVLYGQQRQTDKAIDAFQKAEELYGRITDSEGVTEVRYERGYLLNDLLKLTEARTQLDNALDGARRAGNIYQEIRILLELSRCSSSGGDTAQAQRRATDALNLALTNGMDNLVAKGFIEIGDAVRVRGEDYKEAEKYFKQALEVAQKNKARRNEALALVSLGGLRITLHDADQGLDYIRKALPFYEQGGYRRDASLALNQLGRAYDLKGDYDSALEAFDRGLEIANQVEDQSYLALSHRGIGNVLAHREQFPKALEHYQVTRDIYTRLGNELNKARSLMNLADVFWRLGLYNDARTVLGEAIVIAERPNDQNSQMLARIEMIRTSMALSERHMSDAEALARQALKLNAATGHAPEVKYLLGLAQSYSGKTRQGRLTCEQAVNMAIDEKDPRIKLGAMLAYASTLLEGSDSTEALKISLEAESMSGHALQRESQWCALLIAARASKLAGNEMTAHDYASQAQGVLGHLRQEWGDTAYESYVARPDIKYSLNQLDQILAPK